MMRCARVAPLWLVMLLFARGVSAQTPAPAAQSSDEETPFYAAVDAAATFGHKSAGAFGGELGYHIHKSFDVFLEAGHMSNVGTSDLDARAQGLANSLGGSSSASYKVNFFDLGVRYSLPIDAHPQLHPYVMAGFGLAAVTSETVITVNGQPLGPDQITYSNDLNGKQNKSMLMIGFGAKYAFGERYFADLSYRYGYIFPADAISNDTGIPTQRLQIGVGIRF
jgi:opacity protein-like surface antigen